MRLVILLLIIFVSCKQKQYKYKIYTQKGIYYTDTIEINNNIWSYKNSDSSKIIISSINGINCKIDTL
jgi:hypothetical protein